MVHSGRTEAKDEVKHHLPGKPRPSTFEWLPTPNGCTLGQDCTHRSHIAYQHLTYTYSPRDGCVADIQRHNTHPVEHQSTDLSTHLEPHPSSVQLVRSLQRGRMGRAWSMHGVNTHISSCTSARAPWHTPFDVRPLQLQLL